ncbi:efflux RND transporter periplasmic adaptor subunit [bacterium]|nr:efflux RND transporter periplasmic adaptor subunit [bacterium]
MVTKKKRRLRKWIYIITPLIILLIASFVIKWKYQKKIDIKKKIETIKVSKGLVESKLSTTGEVRLLKTVKVKSDISGTVKKIYFEDGDEVKSRQVLALIEPDKYELLNLYNKRANVQNTQINLEDAKAELTKKRDIYEKIKGTSKDELERLERKLKSAENAYSLALLELKVLEEKLNIAGSDKNLDFSEAFDGKNFKGFEDFQVLAPLSGVIVNKNTEEGELVISGTSSSIEGTTLCVIGELSKKIIYCNVNEIDIPKIRIGYPTKISFDGIPNVTFKGKVKRIATVGIFNSQKSIVTFGVEIDILDEETKLKPAMTCDVDISMEEKKDVIQVPFESIYEEKDKSHVYLKKGEEFEKKVVVTGLEGTDNIEILKGLEVGTEICKNVEEVLKEDPDKDKEEQERRRRQHRRED